jgi:hypothetical protein
MAWKMTHSETGAVLGNYKLLVAILGFLSRRMRPRILPSETKRQTLLIFFQIFFLNFSKDASKMG